MKTLARILTALAIPYLGAGCGGEKASSTPRIINHVRPTLTLDFAPFTDLGCPLDDGFSGWCHDNSPLVALGCHGIEKPSNLLGALEPSYPIVRCYVDCSSGGERTELPSYSYRAGGSCFYTIGGEAAFPVSYLIFRYGQFVLIKTEEHFQDMFAPIETEDEALSYVLAVTGLFGLYGLYSDPGLEYFADVVEDTHVETVEDGYLVQLFHYAAFGCGPHPTSAVDFHVNPQGEIHQLGITPVFSRPSQDNWCID